MKHDVNITRTVQREFGDWRPWISRAVVVISAIACGLAVSGFTWITELASSLFFKLEALHWWAPLLWTPLSTAGIVWLTRRYAIGAAGSGIPQVIAALDSSVDSTQRPLFVSVKLSLAKVWLTSWGVLAGLSLGREGPSVQIAAGLMLSARRWLPKHSAVTPHGLLIAGGSAGIAAAFNAPLAGVVFAIEELSRSPENRNSGLLVTGIVLSGLVAVSIYGNNTYFGVIRVTQFGTGIIFPAVLVALACGLSGGLFSRLLAASLRGNSNDWFSRQRLHNPIVFAAGCGLAVALLGVVTGGMTYGSGYAHTKNMLEGRVDVPSIYVLFKFVATWLTTWSGVPAGIFAPALAIGAALGNDIALWTHYAHSPPLMALGMAGFLAAVTQAPLTSMIIVMEMVDGHALVLSLMACALFASALSRILSRPLYSALADQQLLRVVPPPDLAFAPTGDMGDSSVPPELED